MKLLRRILLFLLIFFVLTLTLIIFFGPKYMESKIKEVAKKEFLVDLSYDNASVDLLGLHFELVGLVLKDASSSELLVSNKRVFADISTDTFLTLSPVIENISIDGLYINIKRDKNGTINLQKYLPKTKKIDESESKKEQYFEIKKLTLTNAKVDIKDEALDISESVRDIDLSLANLSNNPKHFDRYTDANLSLSLLDAKLAIDSNSKPFGKIKNAKVSVEIVKLDARKIKNYLPKSVPEISGIVDLKVHGNIVFDKNINADVGVKAVVDDVKVAAGERSLGVKELFIMLDGCKISATSNSKPEVEIKNSALDLNGVTYSDKNFAKPLTLDFSEANLTLNDLKSLAPTISTFNASVRVDQKSEVSLEGTVDIAEKKMDGKLDVKNLSLLAARSFGVIPPKLDLASANLFANGNIALKFDPKSLEFTYQGKGGVQSLSLYDKLANRHVLGFDNLNINGIDFSLQNRDLKIASVNIEGLKTDIKINKDKELNLQSLFEREENTTKADEEKKELTTQKPFTVAIGTIVLQNGSVIFEDEHIKPNFKANLSKLSGRVTSLYLDKNELSKIELIGMFNNQGQINIKGLLVPNPKNFYLNVKSDIKEIAMPSFSTYTGKFIGYEIDSGKLGLELDYNVIGKELNLDNKISLFGFNLGREVENPDAIKLPYNLAIAILKDSNDNIHIELPVEGRTDDPQIRSGKVIWKLVTQLITKVIAAPFKFIGSLFGGGDDTGYVEFEFGKSKIGQVDGEKISKIITTLKQKQGLKVQIEGFVDGENDFNALKNLEYNRKLAIQKLKDMKKQIPVDEVVILPQEYDKYLNKAYDAEKFPKPRNMLGFTKSIPVEDMRNLILTHIDINEKSLLALSNERALSIKRALMSGEIEESRISISETKLAAPTQKEKIRNSRAEIKLLLK